MGLHQAGEVSTQSFDSESSGLNGQVMHKESKILSEETQEEITTQPSISNAPEKTQSPSVKTKEEKLDSETDAEGLQLDKERRQAALEQYHKIRTELFPEVPDISSEELLELFNRNAIGETVILVDCRSEAERQVSVYKGAVTIAEFEGNIESYIDKEIVAYCAIGRRSGNFLKNLLARYPGIRVRNHAGSVVDWAHVGGPFVEQNTGTPTNRVHPNGTWTSYLPLTRNLQVVN